MSLLTCFLPLFKGDFVENFTFYVCKSPKSLACSLMRGKSTRIMTKLKRSQRKIKLSLTQSTCYINKAKSSQRKALADNEIIIKNDLKITFIIFCTIV